jgi:hypothetical protein
MPKVAIAHIFLCKRPSDQNSTQWHLCLSKSTISFKVSITFLCLPCNSCQNGALCNFCLCRKKGWKIYLWLFHLRNHDRGCVHGEMCKYLAKFSFLCWKLRFYLKVKGAKCSYVCTYHTLSDIVYIHSVPFTTTGTLENILVSTV